MAFTCAHALLVSLLSNMLLDVILAWTKCYFADITLFLLFLVDSHTKKYKFMCKLQDDNDVLWRSPGTPVFTAPECCLGE